MKQTYFFTDILKQTKILLKQLNKKFNFKLKTFTQNKTLYLLQYTTQVFTYIIYISQLYSPTMFVKFKASIK